MRYWLTTHWRHESNEPWNVYCQPQYESKGRELQVGDVVFFYETKTHKGRGGIVCVGEVMERLRPRIWNGEQRGYPLEVPCGKHRIGWVRRDDVLDGTHRGTLRVARGIIPVPEPHALVLMRKFDTPSRRGSS